MKPIFLPGNYTPEMHYPGQELELFRDAFNWKKNLKSYLGPYLSGEILEVGAGIGGSTKILCNENVQRWVCLEPDKKNAQSIKLDIETGTLPAFCEIINGTIADLGLNEYFDAIIYIDVLEHIENDAIELHKAQNHLKPGAILAILAPAHPYLFSAFDNAIGHYRRYDQKRLEKIIPLSLCKKEIKYLDCVGFFASAANKIVLKKNLPGRNQVKAWDKLMVPISRILDPVFSHRVGKSILGIWEKQALNERHGFAAQEKS